MWSNSILIEDLISYKDRSNAPRGYIGGKEYLFSPRFFYRWLPWWIPSWKRWCSAARVLFGKSSAFHFKDSEDWRVVVNPDLSALNRHRWTFNYRAFKNDET